MIAFKTVLLCYREQNSDKQEGRTCPSCATKQDSWVCLQWLFLFEWVPCFRQDRMLIPVLTLMKIFIKERRIMWAEELLKFGFLWVLLHGWIAKYQKKCSHCFSLIAVPHGCFPGDFFGVWGLTKDFIVLHREMLICGGDLFCFSSYLMKSVKLTLELLSSLSLWELHVFSKQRPLAQVRWETGANTSLSDGAVSSGSLNICRKRSA